MTESSNSKKEEWLARWLEGDLPQSKVPLLLEALNDPTFRREAAEALVLKRHMNQLQIPDGDFVSQVVSTIEDHPEADLTDAVIHRIAQDKKQTRPVRNPDGFSWIAAALFLLTASIVTYWLATLKINSQENTTITNQEQVEPEEFIEEKIIEHYETFEPKESDAEPAVLEETPPAHAQEVPEDDAEIEVDSDSKPDIRIQSEPAPQNKTRTRTSRKRALVSKMKDSDKPSSVQMPDPEYLKNQALSKPPFKPIKKHEDPVIKIVPNVKKMVQNLVPENRYCPLEDSHVWPFKRKNTGLKIPTVKIPNHDSFFLGAFVLIDSEQRSSMPMWQSSILGDEKPERLMLYMETDDDLKLKLRVGEKVIHGKTSLKLRIWQHILIGVIRHQNEIYPMIYIDGQREKVTERTSKMPGIRVTAQRTALGSLTFGRNPFRLETFQGYVSEMQLFKLSLNKAK